MFVRAFGKAPSSKLKEAACGRVQSVKLKAQSNRKKAKLKTRGLRQSMKRQSAAFGRAGALRLVE